MWSPVEGQMAPTHGEAQSLAPVGPHVLRGSAVCDGAKCSQTGTRTVPNVSIEKGGAKRFQIGAKPNGTDKFV